MHQPLDHGAMADTQIVLATFMDPERAGAAVNALRAQGVAEENISVAVRHDARDISAEEMAAIDREAEAVGTDVAVGSVAGGLAGFVAGLALFSIPGLGPFLGVGVLAGTLGGAALGSAVGERASHFTALGVPQERADLYHGALAAGHVVVALTTNDRETVMLAREALTLNGAEEIDVHPYRPEVDDAAAGREP